VCRRLRIRARGIGCRAGHARRTRRVARALRERTGFETSEHTGDVSMKTYRSQRKTGFTLVEILIVVIILGILAAIVIPQFTSASQDARKSNMASQLQSLRAQVELYKLQHRDTPPKVITTGWDLFLKCTDDAGSISTSGTPTIPDATFPHGP